MGDANEAKRSLSGMEKLSLETNRFPRDLLQRFMAGNQSGRASFSNEEDESEEIELNLGLSLGGRFGVDKSETRKLIRSSSVAGSLPIVRDDADAVAPPPVSYPALMRTSSLPVESEAEWRKRKELQTLRRMEAKRRRWEKQRNLRGEKEGGDGGGAEVNFRGRVEREQYLAAANRLGIVVAPPNWAAVGGGGVGGQGFGHPSGSIESQGGSSSGMSESESKPIQGSGSCGEASPSSIRSFQDRSNQEAAGSSGSKGRENAGKSVAEIESPSQRPEGLERRGREMGSNSMDNMPCVFTQGDGPNGRRIEGILYKYGKGEEVRIMCICHGSFLSPAEFVKHAGGSDVAHPLKHIVVNPSSGPFL